MEKRTKYILGGLLVVGVLGSIGNRSHTPAPQHGAAVAPAADDRKEQAVRLLVEQLGTRALAEDAYLTAETFAAQTTFDKDSTVFAITVLATAFKDPDERVAAWWAVADLATLGRGGSRALRTCATALAAIRKVERPPYSFLDPLRDAGLRMDLLFAEVATMHKLPGAGAARNLKAAEMLRRDQVEGEALAFAVCSAVNKMGGGRSQGSAARDARQ